MKLFYGDISEGKIQLSDEEQQHIVKVLRMKEGEKIFITNGKGDLAQGYIAFEGKKVALTDIQIHGTTTFPNQAIHIAIAPTKNIDRIEFFVEKATEMGVAEISFLLTEKSERRNINIDKIRKQAIAASKQSLRLHFPKINDLIKLPDFITTISPKQTFIAHCDKTFHRCSLYDITLGKNTTFLIGPEGDFSPNEIKLLANRGIQAISLGPQRLRTETAGVFVAAWAYAQLFE